MEAEVVSTSVWCKRDNQRKSVKLCELCGKKNDCEEYRSAVPAIFVGRRQRAEQLDDEVREMKNSIFDVYFDMGAVLKQIRDEGLYKELGFENLEEYTQKRHGFRYRKAAYLIAIVENCEKAGISKEDVRGIEWTKMKELPELTDENRQEWLMKAKELSVEELRKAVKESRGETDYEEKIYMGFSLSPSQKEIVDRALETAARLTGSDVKSYHLQVLAQEFIGTYGPMDEASVMRFKNLYGEEG